MNLTEDSHTLGRSGLIVSPLALGTMTFRAERWGSGAEGSRAVFEAYVEANGNFIDTADVYSARRSEKMLSVFIADSGLRDHLVVATKSGIPRALGNPLAGGNGAKKLCMRIEGSLTPVCACAVSSHRKNASSWTTGGARQSAMCWPGGGHKL